MSEKNSGEGVLSFILGGIIGACLAILFAPNTGNETRRKLKILLEDLDEKGHDLIADSKGKTEEILSGNKAKTLNRNKK